MKPIWFLLLILVGMFLSGTIMVHQIEIATNGHDDGAVLSFLNYIGFAYGLWLMFSGRRGFRELDNEFQLAELNRRFIEATA